MKNQCIAFLLAGIFLSSSSAYAGSSLGLKEDFVSDSTAAGAFLLMKDNQATSIYADKKDFPGVLRAAGDLQADVERVSGVKPQLITMAPTAKTAVIVGTLGKCEMIDSMVKSGKLKVDAIAGKWESFIIATVDAPLPGVDQALVVVGSDKRGTIYGIYEISEQIGVSPWYWWADVPPKHHDSIYIKPGTYVQGPPAVKYRGIFINDENPCLLNWSNEKFGGLNSKMYTHMFELILRCRGNYLWPAMWGKAFNEDDPQNPVQADYYGVVMGTSHHEPMLRAQQEWTNHRRDFGQQWDYAKNEEGLNKFWTQGVSRNKNYESIFTVGMRGDGDVAMPDAGGFEANKALLEKIIRDQQQILKENVNPDIDQIPQMWAVFTEVQQYWDGGLKIPENVTVLFTDDNVGDIRRVLPENQRNRKGGAGVYYHIDMNGGPYSYKWINTNPLPKIQEQMNLALEYGSKQIWIVNVGDLKPLELPLEFFLRMGFNPISKDNIADYQLRWAQREFGNEHAAEIADLSAKYAKYNAWRKPEVVRPETYSYVNFQEAEKVSQAWNDLVARANKINDTLPKDQKDAYYQLILHPILASANFNDMYMAVGRNNLFARQGRASANAESELAQALFQKDKDLTNFYHTQVANGKWNHQMDQTHIGYTGWQSPNRDALPRMTQVNVPDSTDFGVAVEGSTDVWPTSNASPTLPTVDSINKQRTYIEVFAKGNKSIDFKTSADQPWIALKQDKTPGTSKDARVWIDIDWSKAAEGANNGVISITGGANPINVKLTAIKATAQQEKESAGCFGGLSGPIAFLASDAAKTVAVGDVRWEILPDYGRVSSAMSVFPVTAKSFKPGEAAPYMEYPVYFANAGTYTVDIITSLTLAIDPPRGLSLGVSIDDKSPQVVNVYPNAQAIKDEDLTGRRHGFNAPNNARSMTFQVVVDAPGRHALKLTMVDPTMVVQKVVLHDKPLAPSYFGPPEMKINNAK